MSDLEELLGAVARGWCHPENAGKTMDEDLAEAIVDEVLPLLYRKCDAAIERAEEAEADWEALQEVNIRLAREVLAAEAERDTLATARESQESYLGELEAERDLVVGRIGAAIQHIESGGDRERIIDILFPAEPEGQQ